MTESVASGGPGRRLPSGLRTALVVWVGSRAVLLLVVVGGGLVTNADPARRALGPGGWVLFRLAQYDANLYAALADHGYPAPGLTCCYQAFFPGLPAAMRALAPLTGGSPQVAGLLLAQVFGLAAVILLWFLARDLLGDPRRATLAAVALALTPMTLFFSVPYTESLFLTAALAAWLLARRERWLLSALAVTVACTLRVNGLILLAALGVLVLTRHRPSGRGLLSPGMLAYAAGPLLVLLWFRWLDARAGVPGVWSIAQREGWHRSAAPPWVGARTAWDNIRWAPDWHMLISRWYDVLAIAVVLGATVVLTRRREWPETALVGLSAVPLVFSTMWVSAPRYLLVLFPLHLMLARWLAELTPRLRVAVLGASGMLALLAAFFWGAGWWVA